MASRGRQQWRPAPKKTEQVTLINAEVNSRDAARIAQLTSQGRIAVVKDPIR
ncbi:hypothetical protein JCM18916_3950 [Cutibacterium acnes JCM 18916]|nr:hypothetical protein JCM18916_3950 [Cutibacterium acnes JCM 18916]